MEGWVGSGDSHPGRNDPVRDPVVGGRSAPPRGRGGPPLPGTGSTGLSP